MVRIKEEEEKKNMRKMSLGSMKNGGSINNYEIFLFSFFISTIVTIFYTLYNTLLLIIDKHY